MLFDSTKPGCMIIIVHFHFDLSLRTKLGMSSAHPRPSRGMTQQPVPVGHFLALSFIESGIENNASTAWVYRGDVFGSTPSHFLGD